MLLFNELMWILMSMLCFECATCKERTAFYQIEKNAEWSGNILSRISMQNKMRKKKS